MTVCEQGEIRMVDVSETFVGGLSANTELSANVGPTVAPSAEIEHDHVDGLSNVLLEVQRCAEVFGDFEVDEKLVNLGLHEAHVVKDTLTVEGCQWLLGEGTRMRRLIEPSRRGKAPGHWVSNLGASLGNWNDRRRHRRALLLYRAIDRVAGWLYTYEARKSPVSSSRETPSP